MSARSPPKGEAITVNVRPAQSACALLLALHCVLPTYYQPFTCLFTHQEFAHVAYPTPSSRTAASSTWRGYALSRRQHIRLVTRLAM